MKRRWAALLCALVLGLTACGAEPQPEAPEPEPEEPVIEAFAPTPEPEPEPTPEELEQQALEDLLASLTLEEKVGQLFFVRCPGENAVQDVSAYHLGGYILFGRDFKAADGSWLTTQQVTDTIAAYQSAAMTDTGIPLLMGVDEEGGTVARVSANPNLRAERFRSPQNVLATPYEGDGGAPFNLSALTEDTHEKDLLLKSLGINVNLAPVVDVAADPNSFIYDRTFGVDARLTGEAALTMVEQMAADGMGSVLKHFPGYGDNADTHTGIAVDERSAGVFTAEKELFPFLVHHASHGTTAVLMSHNIITAMDPELPASLSPAVHDLLRREVDFDGVVMTDDLAMEAVAAYAEDGAVAVMALAAGNDLVLTTDYRTQIPKVLEAVENGTLSMEAIDTACLRVLRWKTALGLLEF